MSILHFIPAILYASSMIRKSIDIQHTHSQRSYYIPQKNRTIICAVNILKNMLNG